MASLKIFRLIFFQFLLTLILFVSPLYAQGVAIGNPVGSPDSSALLDLRSTSQGFLMPRMTATDRSAIQNPAQGLMVFNLTSGCPSYFFNGAWYEWCAVGIVPYAHMYAQGAVACTTSLTAVIDVVNPVTGRVWMDRDLGAVKSAAFSTDSLAYGDLYQWGRRSDGHQCRQSLTTTQLSNADQPQHGNFILAPNSPFDWRSPQNNTLWQGLNAINNPCPTGYRVPTEAEMDAERNTWLSNNASGAISSVLKLPVAGYRGGASGTLISVGNGGNYWTSTISGTTSRRFGFDSNGAAFNTGSRSLGFAIRCIKE